MTVVIDPGVDPAVDRSAVPVVVEVIALRVAHRALQWEVSSARLTGRQRPDDLAAHLTGVRGGARPGVVLHSTSWRHTGSDLVVTYALFPDLRAGTGQPLRLHLVTGPGPLAPSPVLVAVEHVAAHAVRHLADLAADRDPHVVSCARERPEDWELLSRYARAVHVEHAPTTGRWLTPATPDLSRLPAERSRGFDTDAPRLAAP